MYRIVDFTEFSTLCEYFVKNADVNKGYGCNHPDQADFAISPSGRMKGCCNCYSCPFGLEAELIDFNDRDVNKGGFTEEDFEPGDFILIDYSKDAPEEVKKALKKYLKYCKRFEAKGDGFIYAWKE